MLLLLLPNLLYTVKMALILLIFICFINAESSNVTIVTPEILFTIPHEGNIIRFECSKNGNVTSWIFPNDVEIHMPKNDTFFIVDDTFNVTKNYLEILGIKHGMDGRYACILDSSTKYNFFIPHIVSDARITKSIMISLSVTGIFCIMCVIILMVDKYCFSDMDDVKAKTLQKSLRKKNASSATMTNLEFPA